MVNIGFISLTVILILALATTFYLISKGAKKIVTNFFSGLSASMLIAILGLVIFPKIEWLSAIETAVGFTAIVIGTLSYPIGRGIKFVIMNILKLRRGFKLKT
jgi:hypothetical protein